MGNCTGACFVKDDPKLINEVSQIIENDSKNNKIIENPRPQSDRLKIDISKQAEKKPVITAENNEIADIDMDFMKENEDKIIKMQAKMKGNMARKQIKK